MGATQLAGAQSAIKVLDVENMGSPDFYIGDAQYVGMSSINGQPAAEFNLLRQWGRIGMNFPTPKNWSTFTGFVFRIQNLENYPISFGARWDLNDTLTDNVSGSLDLAAGETRTFYMDHSSFRPTNFGMRNPFPAISEPYLHWYPWTSGKSLASVYRLQLHLRTVTSARVRIGSVYGKIVDNSLQAFVDDFGQFARSTWSWRIFSSQDLLSRNADEEADLLANPGPGEMLGARSLPLTQFRDKWRAVRTQRGKAYFLTPEGKYFWSLGVTSVGPRSETIVEGREMMFTGLPAFGDPKAQFYGSVVKSGQSRRTYNHYAANLYEKYGASWSTAWITKAKKRMESWGLNTLGAGSGVGSLSNQNMPFTVVLTTDAYPTRLQTPVAFWNTLPDPYGADFTSWMTQNFSTVLNAFGTNPNLIGAFVDGEHSWGSRDGTLREKYQVPLAALNAPQGQPAKNAFVNHLFAKYGTIEALNSAWTTSFPSWQHLRVNRVTLEDPQVASATGDLSAFLYNFAKTYAFRVRAAIKANKPDVLWLGTRESYGTCPNEVFGGLQLYTDVISVTVYDDPAFIPWSYFDALSKPVLIAEWSFTCREGNSFPLVHPHVDAPTQVQRAQKTRAYLDVALSRKNIIGCHWFTYVDQPISGRAQDGENSAFGLVDVTDQPYQEVVNAFRSFTATMYSRRGL